MTTLLQLAQSYNDPESYGFKLAYQKAYLDDLFEGRSIGDLAFQDRVQLAMMGDTVIQGGYLRTELIGAKSIYANQLNVDDLSAVSGHFTDLYAGNYPGGAYMRFRESSDNPFIELFDSAELRVRVEKDRISWYKGGATPKARMIVDESPEGGGNFLSLLTEATDGGILLGGIKGSDRSYIWVAQDDQFVRIQVPGSKFTLAKQDTKATWSGCWTHHWGDFHIDNNLVVAKNVSKASGSFLIDHPLDPDNKNLVHSFIEGPRYDLLYRGEAKLINGRAEINIDDNSSMTSGTFKKLTKNAQVVSLCNQTGFARLMPSEVENGVFSVRCEDAESNDTIAWVVIAERDDPYIYMDRFADKQGRLAPEQLKEIYSPEVLRKRAPAETSELAGFKGHKIHQEAYDKMDLREDRTGHE